MLRPAFILGLTLMSVASGAVAASLPADRIALAAMTPSAEALGAGMSSIGDGALVYRPVSAAAAAPLMVVLHGAGQRPQSMIERLMAMADRRGILLLAPKSAGPTWDLVASIGRGGDPIAMKVRSRPRFGPDPRRIEVALNRLAERVKFDHRRVILAGFSDGASEALSLALANPSTFQSVIAMSPGFVLLPRQGVLSQKIYITHGRSDSVLPFATSNNDISGLIERSGFSPRFLAFDGDHRIDDESLDFALNDILGPSR